MTPSLDHWTIIFALIASQGIVLAILLWTKKDDYYRSLSIAIFLFSIMLIYYVAFWTRYHLALPYWLGVSSLLTYAIAPLFYKHVVVLKDKKPFSSLHYIPFLAVAALYLLSPLLQSSLTISSFIIGGILQSTHLGIYAVLIYQAATKSNNSLHRFIALSFLLYTLSFISYYLLVWTGNLKVEYDYFISVIASAMIYGVGYFGLYASKNKLVKYENSALSPSASKAILNTITAYIDDTKIYRESDLRLNQLSQKLEYSSNHVSQVINELCKKSFTDFINEYRINEACEIIRRSNSKPKFIHIALDVGFNNKTSFYNAFKKVMNCSPTEYYQSLEEKIPV